MENIEQLIKKAKNGNGLAAYILGRSYYSCENGVERDFKKSFEYYKYGFKSLKDPRCKYGYAMFFYDDGESESEGVVKKNNKYANRLFASAYDKLVRLAGSGDKYACFILGAYYNYGLGETEQNFVAALNLIKKAASYGHAGALYDLGKFYATGHGVKQNPITALSYFKLADEMGSNRAKAEIENLNKLIRK